MGFLVAIETTSHVTGAALFEGGELVATLEREGRGDVVLPLVDELLSSRGLGAKEVVRWAVDIGPGSFTGVRVGVATVKGIAFATGAEVVGVDAFDALASLVPPSEAVAVLLSAGKGELYFRVEGQTGHAPAAEIDRMLAARMDWTLVGEGARALGSVAHARMFVDPPFDVPRAEAVGRVARLRPPGDVDALEPFYVRPPDLTRPPERGT